MYVARGNCVQKQITNLGADHATQTEGSEENKV